MEGRREESPIDTLPTVWVPSLGRGRGRRRPVHKRREVRDGRTRGHSPHTEDRGRGVGLLLSLQRAHRDRGQGGHPSRHVPARARRGHGRRRVQPPERPEEVRRGDHPGRSRVRELHGRHRPSLRRQRSHPLSCRRTPAMAVRRTAQFLPGQDLPDRQQTRGDHHGPRPGRRDHAPGLSRPAQRTPRPGDRRDPRRRGRSGDTRGDAELSAAQTGRPGPVPQRRRRRRQAAVDGQEAGHLVRDGGPAWGGHRRAEGAGRAYRHTRLLHPAGQVLLRRAPPPGPGRRQRRHDAAGDGAGSRSRTCCSPSAPA